MKFTYSLILGSALLVLLPERALACPVCFDMSAENRIAFFQTAAVLTLLPLGMIGGLGAWIRKRSRDLAREDAENARDTSE